MPLPKRPHRSPNSDANKTCPVPGFARDVVTVRSAVDLLGGGPGRQSTARYSGGRAAHEGGDVADPQSSPNPDVTSQPGHVERFRTRSGYRPVQISWKRFRSAVLRGTGRPGRRGGERILPHFFTSKSWNTGIRVRKTSRPEGLRATTAPPPDLGGGCRDRDSAGAPLFRFLRSTERAVRRRNEEPRTRRLDRPASGRDPGSPEHHLSRYDATPLSRGTERVVRRRNEETANPPPGPDRRVVVTRAPPEHHLSRYDATPLSRGTERVVRRRNEETANPPPGPDREWS
ncbi:hypothetical protein TNCT_354771 [Trichonephila clavata]|uniref:Uncharacterized protein n=1 Tax=Trichonephila clavata TaxID=2740835 RepID=A0A8X6L2A4_TRICU|nr:hypothetical protein TNCT_354771 [Trichonephila clavata]